MPDAGHSRLIARCQADNSITDVVLTTEEEGVGLVAGAALGGQRAALLMQSSGVGNCINMFSLLRNCGFGCVIFVTMRGEFGEFNPWQVPMGAITEDVLRLAGFLTYRIDEADDVDDIVGAGCDMAFDGNLQVAILLSQRLIGRKQWTKMMLDRRDFVRQLLIDRGDLLVVPRARLGDLRCRRGRRSSAQFLSVGRDGRHRHDRARAGAGAAGPPRRRAHRRRRHADGPRQPCHDRRQAAAQSRHRRAR